MLLALLLLNGVVDDDDDGGEAQLYYQPKGHRNIIAFKSKNSESSFVVHSPITFSYTQCDYVLHIWSCKKGSFNILNKTQPNPQSPIVPLST